MKIHHYTSIENLALILKNKTIRFTRLDKVDDGEEAGLSCSGIPLSYYTFVSCWTHQTEENIPLWKMYAGKEMKGVRITLDSDMFHKYPVHSGSYYGIDILSQEGKVSILPIDKCITRDYVIVPSFNDSEMFFRQIEYVDDPMASMQNAANIKNCGNGIGEITLDLKRIGLYKRKCWTFQQECRFVLNIIPNTSGGIDSCAIANTCVQSLYNKTAPVISFYDLLMESNSFVDMEITLSPTCTEAEKIIIEALVNQFAPQASIASSKLKGVMIK